MVIFTTWQNGHQDPACTDEPNSQQVWGIVRWGRHSLCISFLPGTTILTAQSTLHPKPQRLGSIHAQWQIILTNPLNFRTRWDGLKPWSHPTCCPSGCTGPHNLYILTDFQFHKQPDKFHTAIILDVLSYELSFNTFEINCPPSCTAFSCWQLHSGWATRIFVDHMGGTELNLYAARCHEFNKQLSEVKLSFIWFFYMSIRNKELNSNQK